MGYNSQGLEGFIRWKECHRLKEVEIAKLLGCTQPYVSMILAGTRQPSWDLAEKIEQVTRKVVRVTDWRKEMETKPDIAQTITRYIKNRIRGRSDPWWLAQEIMNHIENNGVKEVLELSEYIDGLFAIENVDITKPALNVLTRKIWGLYHADKI